MMAALSAPAGSCASRERVVCFVALLKINWGIGMMAMGYYIQLLGPLCGVAFFAFTMVITYVSIDRLLQAADACEASRDAPLNAALLGAEKARDEKTYPSVCRDALGPRAETLCVALSVQRQECFSRDSKSSPVVLGRSP